MIVDEPRPEHFWTFWATVDRWKDGDTVVLDIDRGFKQKDEERVWRLYGIDTPELHPRRTVRGVRRTDAYLAREKRDAKRALEVVEALAPVGSRVLIRTVRFTRHDSLGRYLAVVYAAEPTMKHSINRILVGSGLATVKYYGKDPE